MMRDGGTGRAPATVDGPAGRPLRPWADVERAVARLSSFEAAAKAWQSILQAERSRSEPLPVSSDEVVVSLREHRKRLRGAKKLRAGHPCASPELEAYLEVLEADQLRFEVAMAEVVAAVVSDEDVRRVGMWRRLRAGADDALECADGRAFA